ncbi:hypothetical protein PC119_g16300 [Phytophthora cactorum]|nr:hypothetical protein PC119_g16300 [Phytophthora cactorum]KAG3183782.1 hypothetical protein PC128_g14023 [Phytophthora cactorum]KAG4049226.1 hypothetical protein PC123_g15487 [Phytophthora cactorum]
MLNALIPRIKFEWNLRDFDGFLYKPAKTGSTNTLPKRSASSKKDYETHESCEEVEGSAEDLSFFLVDESVAEQASRLIRDDPCEKKCLKGKETELGSLCQGWRGLNA